MLGDCWSRVPQLQKKLLVLAERYSFGGKKTRQNYDAVARFQLESRAGNRDFLGCESQRKATVPEQLRRESSPIALKAAAEDRRAQRPS